MSETNNLFAYGTLMWPEVLEAVIGRKPTGKPATLPGFKRLRVRGECFPVIVKSPDDSVDGILYENLTGPEFALLDRFEGEEYDRAELPVGGIAAQVYVLCEKWAHIAEPVLWQPSDFTPEHRAAFCAEYKGWSKL